MIEDGDILGENERDEMAKMHGLRGRATAGVKVKGLALLNRVQNL